MEPAASAKTPSLAWKWILEKLLDIPNFGLPFLKGVISSHISDIEEPHCEPLLKRVALRVLEEMIDRNQINSDAIPHLKTITGKNLHSRSIKQRFDKELVLRVQTEVVLSVLRKDLDGGERDWALYESELERVFEEAEEEDNRLLDRKRELRDLLEPKNQTKDTVTAYFRKFSLNKLRLDLRSFIVEKRETLDTMFLDQLSRAFLDANGKPFSEDLGGVEKSANVEAANEKQDNVGTVNVESLQQFALGKKRRWDHLSTPNAIGDDESEEADVEGLAAGMKKSRTSPPATPVVSPAKTALLRQRVSKPKPAVRTSGPQLDCFPVNKEVESTKERSLLKRAGEEPLPGSSTLGQDVRSGSSAGVAHSESIGMEEGTELPVREPSQTDQYYVISDSDSDTQNGSDRGHPQGIVEAEFVKETIILQRGRKRLRDRRKEASTGSPEVRVHQREGNERFVTKGFKTLDSEYVCEVDFLGVGCDHGHEEVCHMCGKHGKLLGCEGCPMSMHFDCIKALGLRLPKSVKEWRCPNCLLLKAEREAAEAEEVAVAAKDKLQVFKMESEKMENSPLRRGSRQNEAIRCSLRSSSLQSEENDRVLKPNQESDEESNLGYTEGQDFNSTGPALSEAYLRSGRCEVPGLRRTPLPWTRVEEEVLKKGVYLTRNEEWGPNRWSCILKIGQGTFDPSRTSGDVKDKWRNLVRRANAS